MLFQQLTGINAFIYFLDFLFSKAEAWPVFVNFSTTILIIPLIDRNTLYSLIGIGRKPLFILGSISLSVVGGIIVVLKFVDVDWFADAFTTFVIIYLGLYGLSQGPITYYYFPLR